MGQIMEIAKAEHTIICVMKVIDKAPFLSIWSTLQQKIFPLQNNFAENNLFHFIYRCLVHKWKICFNTKVKTWSFAAWRPSKLHPNMTRESAKGVCGSLVEVWNGLVGCVFWFRHLRVNGHEVTKTMAQEWKDHTNDWQALWGQSFTASRRTFL